jgi:hypothetical protein
MVCAEIARQPGLGYAGCCEDLTARPCSVLGPSLSAALRIVLYLMDPSVLRVLLLAAVILHSRSGVMDIIVRDEDGHYSLCAPRRACYRCALQVPQPYTSLRQDRVNNEIFLRRGHYSGAICGQ